MHCGASGIYIISNLRSKYIETARRIYRFRRKYRHADYLMGLFFRQPLFDHLYLDEIRKKRYHYLKFVLVSDIILSYMEFIMIP